MNVSGALHFVVPSAAKKKEKRKKKKEKKEKKKKEKRKKKKEKTKDQFVYKRLKEEKTKDYDENSLSLGTADALELTFDRPKSISFKVVQSADSMKFNDLMSLCNMLGTFECRTLMLIAAWFANL